MSRRRPPRPCWTRSPRSWAQPRSSRASSVSPWPARRSGKCTRPPWLGRRWSSRSAAPAWWRRSTGTWNSSRTSPSRPPAAGTPPVTTTSSGSPRSSGERCATSSTTSGKGTTPNDSRPMRHGDRRPGSLAHQHAGELAPRHPQGHVSACAERPVHERPAGPALGSAGDDRTVERLDQYRHIAHPHTVGPSTVPRLAS